MVIVSILSFVIFHFSTVNDFIRDVVFIIYFSIKYFKYAE